MMQTIPFLYDDSVDEGDVLEGCGVLDNGDGAGKGDGGMRLRPMKWLWGATTIIVLSQAACVNVI